MEKTEGKKFKWRTVTKEEYDQTKEKLMDTLHSPYLLIDQINFCNDHYIRGERKQIATVLAVMESRLMLGGVGMGLINICHQGAGKSTILKTVKKMYRDEQIIEVNAASPKVLYYEQEPMKHKIMIIHETGALARSSELTDALKSMLSEGYLHYRVATNRKGGWATREYRQEGPLSLLLTGTSKKIDPELYDRLFEISSDESPDQTARIIMGKAADVSGKANQSLEKELELWQLVHSVMWPVEVVVPYATKIAHHLNQRKNRIQARRAFDRLLMVIQSVAAMYQYQRDIDDDGRIIATIADYHMAKQMVDEPFRRSLGQQDERMKLDLDYIRKYSPVSLKVLAEEWGITKQGVSKRISKYVDDGFLCWCDQNGKEADVRGLEKLKRTGKARIKVTEDFCLDEDDSLLPSPFDLTKDIQWLDGGYLFEMYNLHLDSPVSVKNGFEKGVDVKEAEFKDLRNKSDMRLPLIVQ